MQGGKHIDHGSFQELIDNGYHLAPNPKAEIEESPLVVKFTKVSVMGVVLLTVLPTLINSMSFLGLLGGPLLLYALLKLWKVNGWFQTAFVLAAAAFTVCIAKDVAYLVIEDLYSFETIAVADPVLGSVSLLLIVALVMGIRSYNGYTSAWTVLTPVLYGIMFALGFIGGDDWIIVAKALLGAATIVCYYKAYKTV